MSVKNSVFQKSFEASSIFATAYVCAVLGTAANTVGLPTVAGQFAVGVVQEITTVATGQAVPVMVMGVTKVVADGVIAKGDHLGAQITTGYAFVLTGLSGASENCVGIALSSAAAQGEIIEMLLTPGMQYIKGVFTSVSPSASVSPSTSVSPSHSVSSSPSPSAG